MAGYQKTIQFFMYLLRHNADEVNEHLGYDGCFKVEDVLKCMRVSRREISLEELKEAVAQDLSQMFLFNENFSKIKFNTDNLPMNLVPIASFTTPEEAHFYKDLLENEGIPARLSEEYVASVNLLYSNVVGGVKIQVKKSDADRAYQILEEARTTTPEPKAEEEADPEDVCPKCNSRKIRFDAITPGCFWGMVLFLGFPIYYKRQKWICDNCNHTWK